MTDAMQGLLAEAKKGRYSSIRDSLSEDDVASVWDNVSVFLEKQMSQQKGVQIPGLGTFTFSQKKLDIGNNKFILIQRPVFNIAEKFAQTHGLQFTKYHVPGQIPVVPLNFAALSFESPFDRDTVESCVKEILNAVSRAVGAKRNVELTFCGIGRLSIRENRVKMKFFKEFVNHMDGSGKLVDALQNRPGTVDSVISDRCFSRPLTSNTLVLPKITPSNTNIVTGGGNLATVAEGEEEVPEGGGGDTGPGLVGDDLDQAPDPIAAEVPDEVVDEALAAAAAEEQAFELRAEEVVGPNPVVTEEPPLDDFTTANAVENIMNDGEEQPALDTVPPSGPGAPDTRIDEAAQKPPAHGGVVRSLSRMAMPLPKASGVSLMDDFQMPSNRSSKPPTPLVAKSSPAPFDDINVHQTGTPLEKPFSAGHVMPLERAVTFDHTASARQHSAGCGHPHAGQELCYLCHQRTRRNVPVSFVEERKRREDEEERLLQQYQSMKDAEDTLNEHERLLSKRHDLQKMAAFNLGVADANMHKKKARDTDFHRSYIFQRRPLTPPRFPKQHEYFKDLSTQVDARDQVKQKRNADEAFLERLEQVQLAEDLAAQREQYLKDKHDQMDVYKKGLETQITIRDCFRKPDGLLRTPDRPLPARCPPYLDPDLSISQLRVPRPNILRPFAEAKLPFERVSPATLPRLRFKPVPLPSCEPDSEVFGKNDMNNDKMADKRRRAHNLFKEQQDFVAQKKRDAILKRLSAQKEEEDVLARTRKELIDDRANRHHIRFLSRRRLEDDWSKAADMKRGRELEDRLRSLSPGVLVHEQCDKYRRCRQCQRQLRNCGESNIWSESRYIPGSRLMV